MMHINRARLETHLKLTAINASRPILEHIEDHGFDCDDDEVTPQYLPGQSHLNQQICSILANALNVCFFQHQMPL